MRDAATDTRLDEQSFRMIADLAYRESGLQLVAEKTSMIQSRLRKRLTSLGLPDFVEYSAFVCSDKGRPERRHMISALTTNVSHFFRERHHFDTLRDRVMDSALTDLKAGGRMRIWSAGCSNGQEPVSIAMCLLEAEPRLADLDVRILATDIDPLVIDFATTAVYPARMMNGVSPDLCAKYFDEVDGFGEPAFAAKPAVRRMITYRELNLLADWPMKRGFDVVFCRNVVIYFDAKTQAALWPRFRSALSDDGLLFLGHSERIAEAERAGFVNIGPTTYSSARPHGR